MSNDKNAIHDHKIGIEHNRAQFAHQIIQVFFVGLTLGMMRTVIPALANDEFGVPRGSFILLTTFVIAFGFIKGALNFAAGGLSERHGRKAVLLWGWIIAIPIPVVIWYAPNWNWIVFATALLGVNQGLTWSMTQTAKLDITRADERGFTMGLNEFSGYVGVAVAGIVTGYLANTIGTRYGLLIFGLTTIVVALILTLVWVKETKSWAHSENKKQSSNQKSLTTSEIFALVSWRDSRFLALCQAGLVEKFVDALVWIFYPIYFYQRGLSLANIGWVIGVYGFVWGGSQFFTGKLSDKVGRKPPIVFGMWLCGAGVGLTLLYDTVWWWSLSAAVTGFGMALLYPNLSASVADISHPSWRGTSIGVYRFWRDSGYAFGAIALGVISYYTDHIESGFWFVAGSMFLSGFFLFIVGKETHPSITPRK